jgi:predicted signal transduction protein with EAL and GGDEF domain
MGSISLRFDRIKIDQSFIRGTANEAVGRAIVRAVASLGQSLGMVTVAEGVETEEQMARVASDSCTDVHTCAHPAQQASSPCRHIANKWPRAAEDLRSFVIP